MGIYSIGQTVTGGYIFHWTPLLSEQFMEHKLLIIKTKLFQCKTPTSEKIPLMFLTISRIIEISNEDRVDKLKY